MTGFERTVSAQDVGDGAQPLSSVYVDAIGDAWDVSIDCNAVRRVRKLVRSHRIAGIVDPIELADPQSATYEAVIADPVLLCDIVYAIVLPQAKERGVDDEEFSRRLKDEALNRALDALIGGVASFSRSPARRRALGKIHSSLMRTAETLTEACDVVLDPAELTSAMVEGMATALSRGVRRDRPGDVVSHAPP